MDHDINSMTEDIREYILDEIKSSKKEVINIQEDISNTNLNTMDIETEKNNIGLYTYGLAITQGNRKYMEDKYIVETFLDNPLFIILDGHRGSYVSDYCKKNLMRILKKINESSEQNSNIIEYFKLIFEKLILRLDNELLQYADEHSSGSTITLIYLLNTHVISVNLGDSRSIIINKNLTYTELTVDHKPYNPLEKKRIINAHGTVINNRINNDIAISRAIGDFRYKKQTDLTADKQLISNVPHIKLYTKTGEEKYLILSSDGIWDVFTNQKLIDYICLLQNKEHIYDIKDLSKKIIKKSFTYGNVDNTTLFIIKF